MGDAGNAGPLDNSILTNIQITPTRTIMNITAGPIDITVTYLSPIEVCSSGYHLFGPIDLNLPDSLPTPSNSLLHSLISLWKQSQTTAEHMPCRYTPTLMEVSRPFSISIRGFYFQFAEWLSDNTGDSMDWNSQVIDTIIYHEIFLGTPQVLSESSQIAKDSTVYHAMLLVSLATHSYEPLTSIVKRNDMTWEVEAYTDTRLEFGSTGKLRNRALEGPRAIGEYVAASL